MKNFFGWLTAAFKAMPEAGTQPAQAAPSRTPSPAFDPRNDIERMLMEAAVNPAARENFQRALLKADLYAATPDAPAMAGTRTVDKGEKLKLLNVRAPDGASVAAIFTARERIFEFFNTETGYVGMKGETLLECVANIGAWLNPGSPYNVYWTPRDLASALGKPVPRTLTKATDIKLSIPANPPSSLVNSLRAVLGADDRIVEAWFALALWPEEEKGAWYLDIRTDLERSVVQDILVETFRHADYAGRPLDMIVNKPGGRQGIGIRIAPLQTH